MALNSTSKNSQPPWVLMENCCRTPWNTYLEPLKMAPGVYNVSGNDWVASYLIDTNEGLILIDTGMHETVYLLLENIRILGYEPEDIKKILLSHAHVDHIGAARTLKELTGAEIYMGERDMLLLKERRDLIFIENYTCGDFDPDFFYNDNKAVELGNISIKTIATPGHTPGCTSFFFDVKDRDGRNLTCGMHGGIGLLYVTDESFKEAGLPVSLRDEFIHGLKTLDKMHVDICLPSHTNQVGVIQLKNKITEDYNPYDDPSVWHELMNERLDRIETILNKKNIQ